ncbi:MAG: RNA 2',3'-cyclic phosphodiesterase [Candidatus Moranbacteria bacterium CG_4_10_14_3_um_filter_44_15]|nr:MAG: RNA 2',3'-cyclic phosphodiesterase [Candidatus Moranbacteria bacterium CG06_land_8_20_14_3_00_43_56]PIV84190.1 MAG: RNA 2',3'-cyclic phosphodiesterase [Candidatus Moranbacteria bacterium CG17_big_fil_post_rev_8_21_14_2_50_44_12]PIW93635.1 MAG: RNA 2',3'-cyclic phosphodiesterase [Candidatus Moranbacteria bacterium CG_4_8_14_3_um_filter_43_15]PIX91072.1 MAG: RNA 2',3'-cyclic phosphodiesterase [Candidatus Moranbacteria bacterium CG_4_10_14_3_um_filter_44_15]PJA85602.1 MAG: RNA 2',3'-cyclic
MQKRLFVAIGLPEDVKKRLFRFVEKEYGDLPACPAPQLRLHGSNRLSRRIKDQNRLWCGVKWVRWENFHLTLIFLGYVSDENILGVCEVIQSAVQDFQSFELEFVKIEPGPTDEIKKMIWATGEKSDELSDLKYRLDKALGFHVGEKREFRPHITLGRIRKEKWRKILPRTTECYDHLSAGRQDKSVVRGKPEPEVERDFKFSVSVNSIELYESKFEKGKRVYYILESFLLE